MKGFTLVELVVSLAIFMVITCIVIYNYGSFNNDLIVSNLAYEIALEVREAQVYGLSVLGNDNSFDAGYGVHFDANDNKDFFLFVDANGNGRLNNVGVGTFDDSCLPGGECLEKVTLQGNNKIEGFCTTPDDTTVCTAGDNGAMNYPGDTLDITFKRPNPDAIVTLSSQVSQVNDNKDARIYVESNDGVRQKIITVDQSGQISIQ